MTASGPTNAELAAVLERVADLLEAQHASGFRVRAYRAGADALRQLDRPAVDILADQGVDGLVRIPAIGQSIAAAIDELARRGRLAMLDRLEGHVDAADLFATVPGIGDLLAHRIADELHIETLEDLEAAAHDGRLDDIPGFGQRRVRAVQTYLDSILRRPRRGTLDRFTPAPAVADLLAVDELYRQRADEGTLHTIAPRRFNPNGRAWLPVLHDHRHGWHITAMFSNTARAHRLGRTHDWVVIVYERDGVNGQCTVVTEYRGPLTGRRVVRGRERACADHYDRQDVLPGPVASAMIHQLIATVGL